MNKPLHIYVKVIAYTQDELQANSVYKDAYYHFSWKHAN